MIDKPAGLPVHPGRAGGPSVEDFFPPGGGAEERAVAGAPAGPGYRWLPGHRVEEIGACWRHRHVSPVAALRKPIGRWCAACRRSSSGVIDLRARQSDARGELENGAR